jgi:hypothetical protein
MSTADVFLHSDEASVITYHTRLLCTLSDSEFSSSIIKLNGYFLNVRIFEILLEDGFPTPPPQRYKKAESLQVFVLAQIYYSLHINDATVVPENHFPLFVNYTPV